MARLPSVSLVVPSHNGSRFLPECLDSVAQLDYPREVLETIVIDNGSTDETEALPTSTYPWVRVVRPRVRKPGKDGDSQLDRPACESEAGVCAQPRDVVSKFVL